MILAILGFIVGFVILCVGWIVYCYQYTSCPPTQQEIDLLRREAANAKSEDQPLKWMYVADAEEELRASRKPRINLGKVILALGAVVVIASVVHFIRQC